MNYYHITDDTCVYAYNLTEREAETQLARELQSGDCDAQITQFHCHNGCCSAVVGYDECNNAFSHFYCDFCGDTVEPQLAVY